MNSQQRKQRKKLILRVAKELIEGLEYSIYKLEKEEITVAEFVEEFNQFKHFIENPNDIE